MTGSLTARLHKHDDQSPGPQLQRGGAKSWSPISKKGNINIRIQNIKEGQSESGATLCGGDRRHQPTARHLGHCCHYDDEDFDYDDDDEYIRTEEEEESTWFTYSL